jgi:exodeoxyribonuclease VII small subunit
MSNPTPVNATFEQALAELDRVVRELEDGQTSLEDSLARYEQGVHLLKQCHTQLRQAEQRILLVTAVDEAKGPTLEPFDHSATANGNREEPNRRRKKPDEPELWTDS